MSYNDSDDDDYYIDLFEESPESIANNYIPMDKLKVESDSTEEYVNKTIGDVIGDVLEQCSRELPPDPILRLAELLVIKYQEKEKENPNKAKRTKSKRSKKKSDSRKFETAATIAHNVVNIRTSVNSKSIIKPENNEAPKENERKSSSELLSKSKKSNTKSDSRQRKFTKSSIIDVAISNNESRSASSMTSLNSTANTSRSSSSTTKNSDLELNSTLISFKQFSKRRKKRTPTVALPFDKYKEKRGIVQNPQSETNNGSKREVEAVSNDGFDLRKHLKETTKNYKHLTTSK